MNLTKTLKYLFKKLGYDVVRLNGHLGVGTFENELIKLMNDAGVDLVLDIGANRGQFGQKLYDYGYSGKMLSFEPLTKAHGLLIKHSEDNPNWHVYRKCCIGDEEGKVQINLSLKEKNSSVLSIKSTEYNVEKSHYIDSEEVDQITLGTLNQDELVRDSENIFAKLDVQGLEHLILKGLKDVNYNIVGFNIELSLVALYDGQEDYRYICNQLHEFGYDLVYVTPESVRKGRMIQFNGVFLHKSLSFN